MLTLTVLIMLLAMAVSHAEVFEEHSRHDEIRKTVCFTRRANYTITG